jgi:hypothetical protein
VVRRDPEHVPERLALYAAAKLAGPSAAWASEVRRARPDVATDVLVEELLAQSQRIARIDGAIAGTPFFLALVPGYLNYLWQEARMSLRTAALYGRDPAALRTVAELLALRGVHPHVEAAEATLAAVHRDPATALRARWSPRAWARSVKRLLILGGFIEARPTGHQPGIGRRVVATGRIGLLSVAFAFTWIVPIVGVVAMAWACEYHTRQFGHRGRLFYRAEVPLAEARTVRAPRRRSRRSQYRVGRVRASLLTVSLALPIVSLGLLAQFSSSFFGLTWLGLGGVLVGLSLVTATALLGRRR